MDFDEIYHRVYEAWVATGDARYDITLDVLANIELLTLKK